MRLRAAKQPASVWMTCVRIDKSASRKQEATEFTVVFKTEGFNPHPPIQIVALPQSMALGIPTAVHKGNDRIYLMSLVTDLLSDAVFYACYKFIKNRLWAGLRLDPLRSLERSTRL